MGLVSGSSSLRTMTMVSGWHTVADSRSPRALARRRRIRRVIVVRIRAMAPMEPITVPAMAPANSLSEGLAARAYLNVKSWFVMALAETPGETVVVGGRSGRERLLTQGVPPARAEV